MKAVVVRQWGEPDVLKLKEIPSPVAGPGEVLIGLRAAGINPVETYIRSGVYPQLPDLPCVLGGDGAGVVEAVGDGVEGFAVGNRVYVAGILGGKITGCYAEKVVRPANEVFTLPEKVSFAQGAALGVPYATAFYALFNRAAAKPGETVFIHGASGAVGLAAVQLARAHGMTVIGSAGTDDGMKLVLSQGAQHAVDHRKDGYLHSVQALCGADGPHVILEMLANVNLQNDLDIAAKFGRVVIIGNRGTIELNARSAMMNELDILGVALWNCADDDLRLIHKGLIAGLENGSLNPVIKTEMPLADAALAHAAVLQPGALGKIVLIP